MLKIIIAAIIFIFSAGALAAQQTHFACRTHTNSVITVQEDASGSISLSRTESEKVPELDMTAMAQKQILSVNAQNVTITSTNNGKTKVITLKFHGSAGDSQLQIEIKKVLFGTVEFMTISGTGASLDRVTNMISEKEEGINLNGCRIEVTH